MHVLINNHSMILISVCQLVNLMLLTGIRLFVHVLINILSMILDIAYQQLN